MNPFHRTQKIMSRVLVLAAVVCVVAALSGCPTQAPAPCQLQPQGNGAYTVRLTNAGAATAACPAVFGDQWFMDDFPDHIAMRSVAVALPALPDGGTDLNSPTWGKGSYSSKDPDTNDYCIVTSIQKPFFGPVGSTYDVKNLTFLSSALYIGTEWKADITYTPAGGTPCAYTGQAINPTTKCATNADCDPLSQPTNSGINYLYDQGCHLDTWATDLTKLSDGGASGLGICFFNKEFPSLGGFTK